MECFSGAPSRPAVPWSLQARGSSSRANGLPSASVQDQAAGLKVEVWCHGYQQIR